MIRATSLRAHAGAALAALGLGALAACNTAMVGQPAPALSGADWVQPGGGAAAPDLQDRWLLLEFFSPT